MFNRGGVVNNYVVGFLILAVTFGHWRVFLWLNMLSLRILSLGMLSLRMLAVVSLWFCNHVLLMVSKVAWRVVDLVVR